MSIRWHGEAFKGLTREQLGDNLERAAITLKGIVKQSLRIGNKHGDSPSRPGEPPRRRTGRLSGSIAHEVDRDRLRARVGTNLVYAKFLELGTCRMAARPFLRPALENTRDRLAELLVRGR